MTIAAAADGSALGNPGPAGWAWYISDTQWAAGGWDNSTNNRAELQAVISLLHALASVEENILVYCDSKYVINSVTQWIPVWKKKNWKKANKQDVLNRDLMEELDAVLQATKDRGNLVTFEWVKGHNNHALNEAADRRARAAAEAFRNAQPVPVGPGYGGIGAGSTASLTSIPAAHPTATPTVARQDAAATDELVSVTCELPRPMADAIVALAQTRGVHPRTELARLIETALHAHDTRSTS